MDTTTWIGTSNRGFSVYAMEEMRRLFPGAQFFQLVPAELFLAVLPRPYDEVVGVLTVQEPVFLRHIQPVFTEAVLGGDAADLQDVGRHVSAMLAEAARRFVSAPRSSAPRSASPADAPASGGASKHGASEPADGTAAYTASAPARGESASARTAPPSIHAASASAPAYPMPADEATTRASFVSGAKIAVQVRKQEGVSFAYTLPEMKAAIEDALVQAYACQPVVREADWIVSAFLAAGKLYLGVSRPEHNLSDWSGGAIRFQREEGQASRAKFKLLEAERRFSLDLAHFHKALDIGAAPGGWTSLLLERGLEVTAVDPAAMAPDLLRHRRLTFLRKKADEVKFKSGEFDLLVCDMSWSPRQMARLVSGLLYALQSGGTAIITLKLMHGKPFQAIKETVHAFEPGLKLVKAKQLFHNRDELTLYFSKM